MKKYTEYQGRILESVEIESKPFAKMDLILEGIVPGGWSDYAQVLNADTELTEDLQIIYVTRDIGAPGLYIPVYNVSRWLYTIKLRDVMNPMKDRFRLYRRDCEKVMRLTWGMPVGDLHFRNMSTPFVETTGVTVADLANIMAEEGIVLNTRPDSVMGLLYELAAFSETGIAGQKLITMLEYIEDLPYSDRIISYLEEKIAFGLPDSYSNMNEYLNQINTLISFVITQFFGERYATK